MKNQNKQLQTKFQQLSKAYQALKTNFECVQQERTDLIDKLKRESNKNCSQVSQLKQVEEEKRNLIKKLEHTGKLYIFF